MCISVDLPEPDGPMIAAKRAPGKPTVTSDERVHGGLALAVAAAQILGLDDRSRAVPAVENSTGERVSRDPLSAVEARRDRASRRRARRSRRDVRGRP